MNSAELSETGSTRRSQAVPERRRFQGIVQVIRLNWPRYVAAAAILALLFCALRLVQLPALPRLILQTVALILAFWTVASLLVSHWVYDRAGIYDLGWLGGCLGQTPAHWANLHAGFDEFTSRLRAVFPASSGAVWDFHDDLETREPSLARARRMGTGESGALSVSYGALPEREGALDAAFLLFAAHELRSRGGREGLFRELRRVVRPGGSVLLLEHLRDTWSFAVFGFGALHFMSRAEWLRVTREAGFRLERESSITPFVRLFLFRRPV